VLLDQSETDPRSEANNYCLEDVMEGLKKLGVMGERPDVGIGLDWTKQHSVNDIRSILSSKGRPTVHLAIWGIFPKTEALFMNMKSLFGDQCRFILHEVVGEGEGERRYFWNFIKSNGEVYKTVKVLGTFNRYLNEDQLIEGLISIMQGRAL